MSKLRDVIYGRPFLFWHKQNGYPVCDVMSLTTLIFFSLDLMTIEIIVKYVKYEIS